MTISVLQQVSTQNSAAGANLTLAYGSNLTPGSTLVGFASIDTSGAVDITGFSDGTNGSWTILDDVNDTTDQQRLADAYFPNNSSSGTPTVTATFSSAQFRGLWIVEVGGAAAASLDQHTGQTQAGVGSGANAVTSGNKTNTNQPALLLGFTLNNQSSNTDTASAGTGYSAVTGGWSSIYGGSSNKGFSESQRITATGAQAATFTASAAGADWTTLLVILDEATGSAATAGTTQAVGVGLRLGTPISRLRSGLEDTIPSPGPMGLPQGEPSVAIPTTLRLGTPLSRLRSGFEDTTPSPGPIGLLQGEESVAQPLGLRLGTPLSRLRGVYGGDTVPGSTALISGLAVGVGPASGALTGKGTLAGFALGVGPVLASIRGSAALAGSAFAQGPVKGTIGGTATLASLAIGAGLALTSATGSGVLKAVAVGTGFVYSGISGAAILTGSSFGVGPSLGSLTGISLLSAQGMAFGFGYGVGTVSFTFAQTGAGHHKRRFGVLDGDRLLIFDTRADAQKARLRIAEGLGTELAQPAIRRIRVKASMPHPREVLPLAEIKRAALGANAKLTYAKILADKDYAELSRAYHNWLRLEGLRREEEEIATVFLHIL